MRQLAKYLASYAEVETHALASFPSTLHYLHAVVIPAYKETSDFIDNFLTSQLAAQQVLMIVVINQPSTDPNHAPQQALFEQILTYGTVGWQKDNLILLNFEHGNSSCLLVDRFNNAIDGKQGVGLARKIGVDLACQLVSQGVLKCEWLHSTDADASLPNNYFSALSAKLTQLNSQYHQQNAVAACYNFYHQSDDLQIHNANHSYERSLRYYVAGLNYAKSPYSFFTIGSILAFKASAYASVRGFPKKSAGEDFYLLNKLAKVGRVINIEQSIIALTARTSDRVPFGTGPAVLHILTLAQSNQAYCYYHPNVFVLLKSLHQQFSCLFEYKHQLEIWFGLVDKKIVAALRAIHFESFIAKQLNNNQTQFNKQLHIWFDAFKTLKFIHFLRDNYFANIPLEQAITQAEFSLSE